MGPDGEKRPEPPKPDSCSALASKWPWLQRCYLWAYWQTLRHRFGTLVLPQTRRVIGDVSGRQLGSSTTLILSKVMVKEMATMGAMLKIQDETATGRVVAATTLRLVSERITIRELIEARVRQEVAAFNATSEEQVFNGLVQPTDTETQLNVKKGKRIDAAVQVERAIEAFGHNGFLLLLDDKQVEGLDDLIVVTDDSVVSFIKLVPLVGG